MSQPATRVLLVGWEAADWRIMRPLLDPGEMPHLAGVMVSNHFAGIEAAPFPFAAVPAQAIHPPEWRERLAELRVHPMELEGQILRRFVPAIEKVDQEHDKTLHKLAALIAHAMSIHGAATELLAEERWDFAAVYYDSIDHFCHRFMRCHPPRLPWVAEEE